MQLSLISLALTKVYGGTPSFTPLSLFASGEQGAWYDPSDLTTLFQDAAGTMPVTADGQPVGKILDKSGRGNHATQSTAASRPLYKTDGTYHWLQFDGVNDYLATAAIDFTAVKQLSIFSGNSNAAVEGWKLFVLLGNSVANGAFAIQIPQNGTNGSAISYPTAAPSFKQDTWANAGLNVKNVLSHMFNNNAATRQVVTRKNAAEVGFVSGTPYDSGFNNDVLRISGAGSEAFNGNAYSLIVRGAMSTPQEITDTETWVNSKTGAY